ncbi:helix-turn-helix transcriptional regulator [Micromonospora olivasterospora]|uniref:AraC-like DNA-binding protein n=1 Tax=Micromonospora olivasterospora TaxID=1880 RepID=A0A562I2F4_MICOL|nr:AraC family transcriptional regulator [Micromonospora olivasterospora]TWH65132.1 AraC-like DNA-binding protein [Micromonospora olivasterospora]
MTSPPRTRMDQVTAAIDVVKRDLTRPSSLDSLARTVPFSRFHFHRVFRDVTGMTPARFLAASRMAEARRLLLHSFLTVAAISTTVGYTSVGTFTTQFTRLVGTPPEQFRRVVRAVRDAERTLAGGSVRPPAPRPSAGLWLRPDPYAPGDLLVVGWRPVGRGGESESCLVARPGPVGVDIPRDGREYHVRVLLLAAAHATAALVDERPDAYRVGTVVVPAGQRAGTVPIPMRRPRPADPPLLSAEPFAWLLAALRAPGTGEACR